jgi:TRAP-type uncharacterized transport system fused permease subunit
VFVFSPSLLLVAKGFNWPDFWITFIGCILGITALAAALSKFFLTELEGWERTLCIVAALLLIAPGLIPTLIGVALLVPVLLRQISAHRAAGRVALSG